MVFAQLDSDSTVIRLRLDIPSLEFIETQQCFRIVTLAPFPCHNIHLPQSVVEINISNIISIVRIFTATVIRIILTICARDVLIYISHKSF
jgi:hypothetical protein